VLGKQVLYKLQQEALPAVKHFQKLSATLPVTG
jgi:hypothetical protein